MKNGFEGMYKNFEVIKERLDVMDQRLEARFETINQQLDANIRSMQERFVICYVARAEIIEAAHEVLSSCIEYLAPKRI